MLRSFVIMFWCTWLSFKSQQVEHPLSHHNLPQKPLPYVRRHAKKSPKALDSVRQVRATFTTKSYSKIRGDFQCQSLTDRHTDYLKKYTWLFNSAFASKCKTGGLPTTSSCIFLFTKAFSDLLAWRGLYEHWHQCEQLLPVEKRTWSLFSQ